ncbi:MAG: hypothetical protein LW823_03885 [Rickettsiales bacterium]|jgi:hypothetical protein|nr:hypothetical protein [Rickettsiales bacterium]
MAVINITADQAEEILNQGKDRSEGVVIKVEALLAILQKTNVSAERLLKLLDKNLALHATKGDANDPGDSITFSKKALEDIRDRDIGAGIETSER